MLTLCKQSIYYLILTVLAEITGLLIIGYDNWVNYLKNNYLITIIGIIVYLAIIQLLCYFNKNTMAWILFFFTFILNVISLLAAIGKNVPQDIKKIISDRNNKYDDPNKNFDKSANKSCKSSCDEKCDKNTNKPIDFDCNSYCNAECNKIF